jgi:high-affinity K+ transport system ATPase subunit B
VNRDAASANLIPVMIPALGGLIAPFIGIKLLDLLLTALRFV